MWVSFNRCIKHIKILLKRLFISVIPLRFITHRHIFQVFCSFGFHGFYGFIKYFEYCVNSVKRIAYLEKRCQPTEACTVYSAGTRFAWLAASRLYGLEVISMWFCWGVEEAQKALIAPLGCSSSSWQSVSLRFRSGRFALYAEIGAQCNFKNWHQHKTGRTLSYH